MTEGATATSWRMHASCMASAACQATPVSGAEGSAVRIGVGMCCWGAVPGAPHVLQLPAIWRCWGFELRSARLPTAAEPMHPVQRVAHSVCLGVAAPAGAIPGLK